MVTPLLDRMKVDIERRAQLLPAEVKRWVDLAGQDTGNPLKTVGKEGIYQSQIDALKLMMDELQARQTELAKKLLPTATPEEFSVAYLELADEIVSAHEIWRIFRYIIGLHKDANLGPLVDAAGLVARDCYLTCMNKMRDWKLVEEDQFRAPPLVYLEAEMSPSTASRGYSAQSLGFPLRKYKDKRLPIPLILLPSDAASSMWLLAALHHEVGHNLDQDLNLSEGLRTRLLIHLDRQTDPADPNQKLVPDDRQRQWVLWTPEILADAFGIMLGGAGFAHALCWWLLVMAPDPKVKTLDTTAKHPPHYVRVFLIATMLRWFKLPALDEAADSLMQKWDTLQKPDWIADYTADCNFVVDFLFTSKFPQLGDRLLTELAPDMADDIHRVTQLENFLRTSVASPDAKLDSSARWRHVPVAAQIAFINKQNADAAVLDKIQERALKYLASIPRPNKMAGETGTKQFFRDLMRDLKMT